jgi:hypothetical protein
MSLWVAGLWAPELWTEGLWEAGTSIPIVPGRVSGGGGFTMRDMDSRLVEPQAVSRRRENDEALLIHMGVA